MASSVLRIATRQSRLALWQAEHVAARLRAAHAGLEVELVPMTTQGDRILDRTLARVGGKGLFIKELEQALLDGRADIAVHSMKDVPAELPPGMIMSAMLERADPRDAFVSEKYATFASLPAGARLGTASQRRECQLRHARPDVVVAALRGNVETRLARLATGEFDAIVLAVAGLERLGLGARITQPLDASLSLPAVGQGVVGIECRNDTLACELTAVLDAPDASICVAAERAFAHRLGGSCQSPIAAHAAISGSSLHLEGLVGSPDGRRMFRDSTAGRVADGIALGRQLADRLLERGAVNLLEELRGASG
jgi:hydroxymethylbilane synthase